MNHAASIRPSRQSRYPRGLRIEFIESSQLIQVRARIRSVVAARRCQRAYPPVNFDERCRDDQSSIDDTET